LKRESLQNQFYLLKETIMNFLLVDDSKTMRIIQRKALAALGEITFAEAADGVEAMAVIAAHPAGFDLIVVDWNMPNMNGLELVTKIRETDKKTLLIMATTEAEKQRVIDALKAGVNNYVVKPFTADSLQEKVRQTLAKAKAA
jgi:two-component system chemotaxis response regulator CheY